MENEQEYTRLIHKLKSAKKTNDNKTEIEIKKEMEVVWKRLTDPQKDKMSSLMMRVIIFDNVHIPFHG